MYYLIHYRESFPAHGALLLVHNRAYRVMAILDAIGIGDTIRPGDLRSEHTWLKFRAHDYTHWMLVLNTRNRTEKGLQLVFDRAFSVPGAPPGERQIRVRCSAKHNVAWTHCAYYRLVRGGYFEHADMWYSVDDADWGPFRECPL